jgi:hypothetical protein
VNAGSEASGGDERITCDVAIPAGDRTTAGTRNKVHEEACRWAQELGRSEKGHTGRVLKDDLHFRRGELPHLPVTLMRRMVRGGTPGDWVNVLYRSVISGRDVRAVHNASGIENNEVDDDCGSENGKLTSFDLRNGCQCCGLIYVFKKKNSKEKERA